MKVKVIPDIEGCRDLSELDDEGNMLIEQSTYDEYKAWVKNLLDHCLGKNIFYESGKCQWVFGEDFMVKINPSDEAAKEEAQWAEYFIGECGFAESIRRG